MAGTRLAALVLTSEERAELSSLASRSKTSQALALRARIVLACASGAQNQDVAAELGVHPMTVGKWRRRYLVHRLEGLQPSGDTASVSPQPPHSRPSELLVQDTRA